MNECDGNLSGETALGEQTGPIRNLSDALDLSIDTVREW